MTRDEMREMCRTAAERQKASIDRWMADPAVRDQLRRNYEALIEARSKRRALDALGEETRG